MSDIFDKAFSTDNTGIPINIPEAVVSQGSGSDIFDKAFSTSTTSSASSPSSSDFLFSGEDAEKSELVRYGWALETNLVGDLLRLGRAALNSEKTIKDIEAERIASIYEDPRFAKFKDGSMDNNPYVWAGRIGVMASDPVYAFMPWARAAQAGKFIGKGGVALAGLGSTVGAGDAVIRSKARTGEIDWKQVGLGATIGGGATVVLGAAGKAVPYIAPGLFKNKKIAEAAVASAKSKTTPLLSEAETTILNSVFKTDKITLAFKNVEKTETNLISFIKQREFLSGQVTKKIQNIRKIKEGTPITSKTITTTTGSSPGTLVESINKVNQKALNNAKGDLRKLRESRTRFLKNWDDTIGQAQTKMARAHSDYYLDVLRALEAKQGLTQKVFRGFAYNLTRPVVGGLFGAGGATLFGADDRGVMIWAGIGAGLGATSRMLRSGLVTGIPKNKQAEIAKEINGAWLNQTLRWININMSTTTSTKLSSHGKILDEVSTLLFPKFMKTPVRNKKGELLPNEQQPTLGIGDSVEDATRQQTNLWMRGIEDTLDGASLSIQKEALRLVRGDKTIDATPEVQALAGRIKNYVSRFKKYYNDVGIKEKNIYDNFFFRKYNYEKINASVESQEAFRKTVVQIYKNLGNKNPKQAAVSFINSVNTSRANTIISKETIGKTSLKGNMNLPLTEHIKFDRVLQGDYTKVEKLLMDSGWIVDDVRQVLLDVVQRSVRSVEFARKFGPNGEFLNPIIKRLAKQYKDEGFKLGQEGTKGVYGTAHQQELNYLADTINGYFGRFGSADKVPYLFKSAAAIATSMANFNMMDKVTIANLGDLVQPFVNSNNFTSALKAIPGFGQYFRGFQGEGTALLAKNERGVAKLLDEAAVKDVQESIANTFIAGQGVDAAFNSKAVFGAGATARKVNEKFFKLVGLQYITDFSRRFAFNAGAIDAHKSLINISKMLNKGKYKSIDDLFAKKPGSIKHLIDSGVVKVQGNKIINADELTSLGNFKTPEEMLNSLAGRKFLIRAGNYAANRDAIIPTIGNRLLFTQSRNPIVRVFGQFSSWAQAKTAQTDAMIARIDEGSAPGAKQALLMILSLSLYAGIKDVRDLVTYGHVRNNSPFLGHPDINWPTVTAEAMNMSGMYGWMGTTFMNNTVGYGSDRPTSIAPFQQIITDTILAGTKTGQALTGTKSWEEAYKQYWRLAPLPTWRKFFTRQLGINLIGAPETLTQSKTPTQKFFTGLE